MRVLKRFWNCLNCLESFKWFCIGFRGFEMFEEILKDIESYERLSKGLKSIEVSE